MARAGGRGRPHGPRGPPSRKRRGARPCSAGRSSRADTGTPDPPGAGARERQNVRDSRLATTDAQGRFEIRELAAGRYTVTASKGGFVTLQYGQRRPGESGTPLELGDAHRRSTS